MTHEEVVQRNNGQAVQNGWNDEQIRQQTPIHVFDIDGVATDTYSYGKGITKQFNTGNFKPFYDTAEKVSTEVVNTITRLVRNGEHVFFNSSSLGTEFHGNKLSFAQAHDFDLNKFNEKGVAAKMHQFKQILRALPVDVAMQLSPTRNLIVTQPSLGETKTSTLERRLNELGIDYEKSNIHAYEDETSNLFGKKDQDTGEVVVPGYEQWGIPKENLHHVLPKGFTYNERFFNPDAPLPSPLEDIGFNPIYALKPENPSTFGEYSNQQIDFLMPGYRDIARQIAQQESQRISDEQNMELLDIFYAAVQNGWNDEQIRQQTPNLPDILRQQYKLKAIQQYRQDYPEMRPQLQDKLTEVVQKVKRPYIDKSRGYVFSPSLMNNFAFNKKRGYDGWLAIQEAVSRSPLTAGQDEDTAKLDLAFQAGIGVENRVNTLMQNVGDLDTLRKAFARPISTVDGNKEIIDQREQVPVSFTVDPKVAEKMAVQLGPDLAGAWQQYGMTTHVGKDTLQGIADYVQELPDKTIITDIKTFGVHGNDESEDRLRNQYIDQLQEYALMYWDSHPERRKLPLYTQLGAFKLSEPKGIVNGKGKLIRKQGSIDDFFIVPGNPNMAGINQPWNPAPEQVHDGNKGIAAVRKAIKGRINDFQSYLKNGREGYLWGSFTEHAGQADAIAAGSNIKSVTFNEDANIIRDATSQQQVEIERDDEGDVTGDINIVDAGIGSLEGDLSELSDVELLRTATEETERIRADINRVDNATLAQALLDLRGALNSQNYDTAFRETWRYQRFLMDHPEAAPNGYTVEGEVNRSLMDRVGLTGYLTHEGKLTPQAQQIRDSFDRYVLGREHYEGIKEAEALYKKQAKQKESEQKRKLRAEQSAQNKQARMEQRRGVQLTYRDMERDLIPQSFQDIYGVEEKYQQARHDINTKDMEQWARSIFSLDRAIKQANQSTNAFYGTLRGIGERIGSIPLYNGERQVHLAGASIQQIQQASSGFVPHIVQRPLSYIGGAVNSMMQNWWSRTYEMPYKGITAVQGVMGGTLSSIGMVAGHMLGGPVGGMVGAGLGGAISGIPGMVTQIKGNFAENFIKTCVSEITTALNLMSAAVQTALIPIRLIASAFKALSKLLHGIGKTLGNLVKIGGVTIGAGIALGLKAFKDLDKFVKQWLSQLSNLGTPITGLSNIRYPDYQNLGRADTVVGFSQGTLSKSIETFGEAKANLWSRGQLDESRVVASALLGVFNPVYSNGANTQEDYANTVNSIYRQYRHAGSPQAKRRILALARTIDDNLPQTIQVMDDLNTYGERKGTIRSFKDLQQYRNVFYREINDTERANYRIRNMEYTTIQESIGNSKMKIATGLWTWGFRDFEDGINRVWNAIANKDFKSAGDIAANTLSTMWAKIKAFFRSNDWKQLSEPVIDWFQGALKDVVQWVKDGGLSNIWNSVKDIVGKGWNALLDFINKNDLMGKIVDIGAGIAVSIGSFLSPVAVAIKDWIRKIGTWVLDEVEFIYAYLRGIKIDYVELFKAIQGKGDWDKAISWKGDYAGTSIRDVYDYTYKYVNGWDVSGSNKDAVQEIQNALSQDADWGTLWKIMAKYKDSDIKFQPYWAAGRNPDGTPQYIMDPKFPLMTPRDVLQRIETSMGAEGFPYFLRNIGEINDTEFLKSVSGNMRLRVLSAAERTAEYPLVQEAKGAINDAVAFVDDLFKGVVPQDLEELKSLLRQLINRARVDVSVDVKVDKQGNVTTNTNVPAQKTSTQDDDSYHIRKAVGQRPVPKW